MRQPRAQFLPSPVRVSEWAAIALITAGAAVLRLIHVGQVPPDPFYDAAVRSMTLSWHNFFFGAVEPSGAVAIDKPPVDLWLQVVSTKLFGFGSASLKLPQALAGTLAVPLLFLATRPVFGVRAGIAAALALAVLPIEVITARSDTMDGVMMLLLVLALWLIGRACQSGRYAWLLAGAATLGIAFDVKLLESIVALPGLALLTYLGMPAQSGTSRRRRELVRLSRMLGAGALYVAVALAWLGATLLYPAHERPYASGSTNGSAWNAAFVFNGTDRLAGKSIEPQSVYQPGKHYPVATQSERDHIPIVPPSPTRLLARIGPLSGERLGLELLVGLLLGIPALGAAVGGDVRRARARAGPDSGAEEDATVGGSPPHESTAEAQARMRRAVAAGLIVWTATGIALFSDMARLHPRYVEGFTPAVAALLGIGVAWAASGTGRARLLALGVALAATVYYVERLLYGRPGVWWITLAGALGALTFAALARLGLREGATTRATVLSGATIVMVLVAVLTMGLSADLTAIRNRVGDAGYVGALPGEEQRQVSAYLLAHQGSARYEMAAESATQIGSLIVQDARPVVVLTTYEARVFTNVAKLKRLIAEGEVHYAFLNTYCGRVAANVNAACSAPAKWIRAHGTDVSRQAGLSRHKVLWLLPGAKP
jgi:4-amino-4-deoxy-L-arabinose transferase-like glycosyltransferase